MLEYIPLHITVTSYQLKDQGPGSIKICHLTSIGNPIVEIRRSYDRLISTMGFPILVKGHFNIGSGPRLTQCHTMLPFSLFFDGF